jgi:hypothetical protein
MGNFYTKEEATEFKDDCDIQLDELRESLKPLSTKTEVAKVQAELKTKIDKNLEKTSLIKDCTKDKATL